MTSRLGSILVMLVIASACAAAAEPDSGPSFEEYRAVIDRNIFSRQRQPAPKPGESSTAPASQQPESASPAAAEIAPPPPNPAEQVVLIGVSIVGERGTAIFENRAEHRIIKCRPGHTLLNFTIGEITLDRVIVMAGDDRHPVRPGDTLAGSPAPLAGPASSTITKPATGPASERAAAEPDSDARAQLIERLRQRRQQELNR